MFSGSDSFEGLASEVGQFPDVFGAEVSEFIFFPIGPEVFNRIEFWGVSGEALDPKPVGVVE